MTLYIRNWCLKNRLKFMHYKKKSLFHRDSKSFKEIEPHQKTKPADVETEQKPPVIKRQIVPPNLNHKTTNFDKWLMSWVMKRNFPTKADVPDIVSDHAYHRARSLFRIRVNILAMIFVAIVCFIAVKKGKYLRDQGVDIGQQVLERKERKREEYLKEQARLKAKAEET